MECRQCEEAKKGTGCIIGGMCGKTAKTAELQDVLIYSLSGVAMIADKAKKQGMNVNEAIEHLYVSLFSTLTNVNFDDRYFKDRIKRSKELMVRFSTKSEYGIDCIDYDYKKLNERTGEMGIFCLDDNPDLRSLRELLLYGLKGLAAYYYHAKVLGYSDESVEDFLIKGMIAVREDLSADELTSKVLECGKTGVTCMALLDRANTEKYGTPEVTSVNLGTRNNPGILITGHDLKDLEDLLEQSKGTGVDVYTHGEMLPANAYPFFKKYDHLAGNYGGAWHKQKTEFESFNGPILVTTNCLIPPGDSYKDRLFTTGVTGFKGVKHINAVRGRKDFSKIISMAKKCKPPKMIDDKCIPIGFAHATTLGVADKILAAIESGALKRFVVMAGCDGRSGARSYYKDFSEALPDDTVILTAGCAKYRYNKLDLGDIGGIPRVIDAGQCNDCYSLVVVALKLAEVLDVSVNDLPISFNISWYEQKACLVLLALLHLNVKNIMLGPTLPAFVTPNILNVLVENFGITGISDVKNDMVKLNIS
jgi:hydroxylamine reductase